MLTSLCKYYYYYLSPVLRNRDPCSERFPVLQNVQRNTPEPSEQTCIFSPSYFAFYFFFFFPSLRSPAKSFPWWWRVVFASSVDMVSSRSLSPFLAKSTIAVLLSGLYLTKWTKCSVPLHLFFYHTVYTSSIPVAISIVSFFLLLLHQKIHTYFIPIKTKQKTKQFYSYTIYYQGSQCHGNVREF